MQLYGAAVVALTLGQVSASTGNLTWSPCSILSADIHGVDNPNDAEYTMYAAPLCHAGVCETPTSVKPTIDVYVKCLRADKENEKASTVWLLQGGIDFDPSAFDGLTLELFNELGGEANVCMMDHRGTGRGTLLKCESADNPDPSQVPACAKELEERYGDLAAFSTTSAAMDLVTFIKDHGSDFITTVYGVGYGTLVAERVMHLNPPKVFGYVLDAVGTTAGASVDQFWNISSLDANFGEVGDEFMALCSKDSECSAHFKKKGLKASVQHLMTKLDKSPKSICAKLVEKTLKTGQESDPPSFVLRRLFGYLLVDWRMRVLLPPLVHRLLRCGEQDTEALTQLLVMANLHLAVDKKADEYTSSLLDNLILMSEMWESPTPSAATVKARYQGSLMSGYLTYQNVPKYCAYSKEKSPTCNKLKLSNYKGNGIIYDRDEYWNKAATIPKQASVLLMSSAMDPLMPSKYAEALLEALDGDQKELVTFKYGAQGSRATSDSVAACGISIVTSYVKSGGDLSKLEKSCVADEALNMTVSIDYRGLYFGTNDPYDGTYDVKFPDKLMGKAGLSLFSTSSSEDEGASDSTSDESPAESMSDSMSGYDSDDLVPESAEDDWDSLVKNLEGRPDYTQGSSQQE